MKKMNNNMDINFVELEGYNEVKSVTINEKFYYANDLSNDTVELLTVLTYGQCTNESIETICKEILGYETVLNAINEIEELGYKMVDDKTKRKLIIDKNKIKYEGMMR